jgi:hypothetical protein
MPPIIWQGRRVTDLATVRQAQKKLSGAFLNKKTLVVLTTLGVSRVMSSPTAF